jgi:hypothetical protein
MNLIEELADVIADSGTHYGKAMNLLPIFAEWIKGIEIDNTVISNYGYFRDIILSELEKMK